MNTDFSKIIMLFYADPGVGKTTVAMTAESAILLDFDLGSYRSATLGECDVEKIENWGQLQDRLKLGFSDYKTIILDSVTRILDVMSADIIHTYPSASKKDGAMTQQGYGILKAAFATFISQLRDTGCDIILVGHCAEFTNGDLKCKELSATGSSGDLVQQISDVIGYMYVGNKGVRYLDFNQSAVITAKNPHNVFGNLPIGLPNKDNMFDFCANLISKVKKKIFEVETAAKEHGKYLKSLRNSIPFVETVDDVNEIMLKISVINSDVMQYNIKNLLWIRLKELGIDYNKETKSFFKKEEVENEG